MSQQEIVSIRKAEMLLTDAERSGDGAALEGLLADDFEGIDAHSRKVDKATFIGSMSSPELKFQKLEIEDVSIRLHGAAGVVTGRSIWKGAVSGREFEGSAGFLDIWILRGGRWQLFASSVTPESRG